MVGVQFGGDDRAQARLLYRRHVGEVTRFFGNKVSDVECGDLVAQTFVQVLEALPRFRAETSVRRFIYAIAQNVLRTHLRTKYKRARETTDFESVCVAELAPRTLSSIVAQKRELQAFVEGLRHIPLADQTLLELRYFEAMTGPQLAEVFDVPEGTLRGRLRRATQRLRDAVHDQFAGTGGDVDAAVFERWSAEVRVLLGRDPEAT